MLKLNQTIVKKKKNGEVGKMDINRGHPEYDNFKEQLRATFSDLRSKKIFARMDLLCCQTCGCAEVENKAKPEEWGYAFYHGQDAENINPDSEDGLSVCLAWGLTHDKDDDETWNKLVSAILDSARKNNLLISWNGSRDMRISLVYRRVVEA